MKVCYLNNDSRWNTGAGRFLNSLLGALKAAIPGIQPDVLTSENLLYPNKFKLMLALPAIRKVFSRCDVIHALDGWPYGVIAALASVGLGKKLVITAIGTGAVKPLYRPLIKPLMIWAYRRANRVIAVSNHTKKEILKIIPDLEIEVIPHGVDTDRLKTIHVGYQAEAQKLQPYIFSLGSLKKRKGFEYSIEAFASAAGRLPQLKYIIVGGGSEHENLKLKIKNLGLTEKVLFLTNLHQDYVNALYQNAELFILLPQDVNKDIEGFGLVFLEAAAAGLPVIATKGTSAEDAVLDGRNGVLVPPANAGAAAEAMMKILTEKGLKEKMSRESVNFAQSMTWGRTAEAYKKVYLNLNAGL